VETLSGEFLHYTKRSLSEHHAVMDSYTSLAAEYLYSRRRGAGIGDLLFRPAAAFLRSYVLKQGFRDGLPGFIISVQTAYGVFLRYAKVWEKTNVEPEESEVRTVTGATRE
jgi:hypothetical protein